MTRSPATQAISAVQPLGGEQLIGRFRVLRPLGHGSEGVVYLAFDPQLRREVAIKTLSPGAARRSTTAAQLLNSVRTASTLSHPNIVTVFEAGTHQGILYVVFEYVKGNTLAQTLAADGPLSMARAVVLMNQVLAGVAQMHERSLIHGDIKPSNILVGAGDLARIADFGLLRHERATHINSASGTLRYMAPECFEGGAADCRRDVFALGLVFHEMLTGEPVFARGTGHAQIYRIVNEIPQPPSAKNARIAPEIDAIILKALQKNPAQRYGNAGEMKRELDRLRVSPSAGDSVEVRDQTVHSTVEFLVRRMAHHSDFPALSASFTSINQIATEADDASIKALSDRVMRDFALTQKLLRLVNSAAMGAGKVTKVSQAITVLGLRQLRAVATAMMLANSGNGKQSPGTAAALTDAFVAGVISRNIGRAVGLAAVEELFICGMFSLLGELLALHYLAGEHAEIARRIAQKAAEPDAAASAVLGLTFSELGIGVARHWQFPPAIINALAPLPPGTLERAGAPADRMWQCAGYARELCALARKPAAAARERALAAHIERYAQSIAADSSKVRLLMRHSVDAAGHYIAAAGLAVTKTAMLEGMSALCAASARETPDAAASQRAGAEVAAAAVQSRIAAEVPRNPAAATTRAGWRARLAHAWRSHF